MSDLTKEELVMWGDWNRPGNRDRFNAMLHKMIERQMAKEDAADRAAGKPTAAERALIRIDRDRLIDDARD